MNTATTQKQDNSYHPNPVLDLILKRYLDTAKDSIRGPCAVRGDARDLRLNSDQQVDALRKIPDENKLRQTHLDEFSVSCFNVCGEKRICFAELVQAVLKDFSVHDIFAKRDELLIYSGKCAPQQLDSLKVAGVLPWTSTSANIVTKTDAFRLIGALTGKRAPRTELRSMGPRSFEVFHECFGGCVGIFDPDAYTEPSALCIICKECQSIFSTKKFVHHNHVTFDEVHTCHWGFDNSRWRYYILLVDQNPPKELKSLWESVKLKFDATRLKKRGKSVLAADVDLMNFLCSPVPKKTQLSPVEVALNDQESSRYSSLNAPRSSKDARSSAFQPWSSNSSVSSRDGDVFPPPGSPFNYASPSRGFAGTTGKCQPLPTGVSPFASPSAPATSRSRPPATSPRAFARTDATSSSSIDSCRHGALTTSGGPPYSLELCRLTKSVEDTLLAHLPSEFTQKLALQSLSRRLVAEFQASLIEQEERVQELRTSNQRLQTELHLTGVEFQRKLAEAYHSHRLLEQDLEAWQREYLKDRPKGTAGWSDRSHEPSKSRSISEARVFEQPQPPSTVDQSLLRSMQEELAMTRLRAQQMESECRRWQAAARGRSVVPPSPPGDCVSLTNPGPTSEPTSHTPSMKERLAESQSNTPGSNSGCTPIADTVSSQA